MNAMKYFFSLTLLLAIVVSCTKDKYTDTAFINTNVAPDKLSALFDITQDNTGLVTITPNGEGGTTYDVFFGDATTASVSVAGGTGTQHKYAEGVYTVKLVAHNLTGKTTETTTKLTVSFKAPENLSVTAALDASNIFKVNVTAKADYETLFKVYYGDVANEIPKSFLEGETVSHIYAAVGTYTLKVVALSGGVATTEFTKIITVVDPVLLPLDFESPTLVYTFGDFGGGVATVIANPKSGGINTSTKVGKMVKNAGEVYGGSSTKLGSPIDFSTNKIFRMKVYSPRVGAKVLLKVENPSDNTINFEKEVATTVANAWEDLVFDYSLINTAKVYQNLVLIFDNGTAGDGSANYTFLFDDIRLTNTLPSIYLSLPVTFDVAGVNYAVVDFGNNATVDAVDPTNAANKVKKTTKPAGAETWAGTTMGKGFAPKLPFVAGATQMSVNVYSPAAGIKVKLKVEDKTDGTKSVETDVNTTVANGWETLVFDFTKNSLNTSAINYTYTYDLASIFFDFGNAGSGKVFYWDEVKFLPATVTPTGVALPLDFQSATLTYAFTDFNGGGATVVNNPFATGINTSTKVGKMVKSAGETWGGSWIAMAAPMSFATTKTFKMKVYSPKVGAKVLLKVENMTDGSISYEEEVATTTANAWEQLTFDYSAIDATKSYQKVVLIFELGTMGDGGPNFTYYFDDITLN